MTYPLHIRSSIIIKKQTDLNREEGFKFSFVINKPFIGTTKQRLT